MVWGLLVSVTLTAQPTVSSDVLEPSVRNEVRHALSRAPSVAATNALSRAAADFARLYETNGLSATDAAIRFIAAKAKRQALGESDYPLDEDFLASLPRIGSAAGVALGIDRLVMALTGATEIASVRAPL